MRAESFLSCLFRNLIGRRYGGWECIRRTNGDQSTHNNWYNRNVFASRSAYSHQHHVHLPVALRTNLTAKSVLFGWSYSSHYSNDQTLAALSRLRVNFSLLHLRRFSLTIKMNANAFLWACKSVDSASWRKQTAYCHSSTTYITLHYTGFW